MSCRRIGTDQVEVLANLRMEPHVLKAFERSRLSMSGTSLICAIGLGVVAALISDVTAQSGLQDPPPLTRAPAAINSVP